MCHAFILTHDHRAVNGGNYGQCTDDGVIGRPEPVACQSRISAVVTSLSGNADEKLESILRHREQLVADLQHYELTSSLEKYVTSKVEDVVERSLRERLDAAKNILVSRQIKDIKARLEVLDAWMENNSLD